MNGQAVGHSEATKAEDAKPTKATTKIAEANFISETVVWVQKLNEN
jgi:hypothetical protein